MDRVYNIDITKIQPNQNQPRKSFDEQKLLELSGSIKKYGLLQPIILQVDNKKISIYDPKQTFTIIAGERRYRASLLADLKYIRALVYSSDDVEEVAIIENMQRKNLNKIEEAVAIKALMNKRRYTQEEMGKVLSKSRAYIANALRILNLSENIQQAIIDEKISDAHARVLAGIESENQKQTLLKKIINEKMSVRETEKYSKNIKKKDVFLSAIINELEEKLDSKIEIKGNTSSGTLQISYNDESKLEEIINLLLEKESL